MENSRWSPLAPATVKRVAAPADTHRRLMPARVRLPRSRLPKLPVEFRLQAVGGCRPGTSVDAVGDSEKTKAISAEMSAPKFVSAAGYLLSCSRKQDFRLIFGSSTVAPRRRLRFSPAYGGPTRLLHQHHYIAPDDASVGTSRRPHLSAKGSAGNTGAEKQSADVPGCPCEASMAPGAMRECHVEGCTGHAGSACGKPPAAGPRGSGHVPLRQVAACSGRV